MSRVLVSLLLLTLLACDQTDDRGYAQFDARLNAMAGARERELLGAMGRIPDSSYQLADQTKILQWWWDTSYAGPACTPMHYDRRAIGIYAPPRSVREDCIVQWTVSKGASQTYNWRGYGCRSVRIVSMPAP
jgi:hypothetical protein